MGTTAEFTRIFRKLTGPLALGFVLASDFTLLCQAEPVVSPKEATVAGKTIGEWTAAWWQWGVGLPTPNDPFTDTTGANAGLDQSGPVFFLAGNPTGSSLRSFNMSAGKYLLAPLLAVEWSQDKLGFAQSAQEIRQAAIAFADQVDSLHATIDGQAAPDLVGHREISPDFQSASVPGNVAGVPAGFSINDTDTIRVVSEPGSLLLLGTALLGLFAIRTRLVSSLRGVPT